MRILAATSELFRRQGMTGTGLKQIAQSANAPFGSIYHFFPGGKGQLSEEVVRVWGAMYGDLVMTVFDACPDLLTAIDVAFRAAGESLVATDFVDGCPIATVALEVASTDETLRIATADSFNDWIDRGVERLKDSGLDEDARRRLIIGFINSLEGAFVLARAMRSTEPLEAAGRMVRAAALAELEALKE
ncbi:TetR/AcrR family transcriptional regulator [Antrihabitans stalactiti]|uniref:TetR/AcrR family transcriptional regulator n=1 Tax=Antrihabitans stalactiti TaxID=2584121 RepID=A0A848KDL9_9NOCA|nr:TetR/AcrR family transcriptional regulator [Antrihabitans stalactiti]NMN95678.1 TetR/AcrR family transcriptional regulator [Antrihabitans stalactiti]